MENGITEKSYDIFYQVTTQDPLEYLDTIIIEDDNFVEELLPILGFRGVDYLNELSKMENRFELLKALAENEAFGFYIVPEKEIKKIEIATALVRNPKGIYVVTETLENNLYYNILKVLAKAETTEEELNLIKENLFTNLNLPNEDIIFLERTHSLWKTKKETTPQS
jgi:hypothetical protein